MRRLLLLILIFFSLTNSSKADFYCLFLSSDSKNPSPAYSHVWATFVDCQNDKIIEEFTISWSPKTPWRISDRKVEGLNKSLKDSIEDALKYKRVIILHGTFKLDEKYYNIAKRRYNELEAGEFAYKALDHRARKNVNVPGINCIHAISDIGGYMKTGTKFGQQVSSMIVKEFTEKKIFHVVQYEKLIILLGFNKYPQIIRR